MLYTVNVKNNSVFTVINFLLPDFIVNAINKLRLLLADLHGDDEVIGCARQ